MTEQETAFTTVDEAFAAMAPGTRWVRRYDGSDRTWTGTVVRARGTTTRWLQWDGAAPDRYPTRYDRDEVRGRQFRAWVVQDDGVLRDVYDNMTLEPLGDAASASGAA